MKIYPNPAKKVLNITSPMVTDKELTYKITDITGKSTATNILTSKAINVSDLHPGIYFLHLYIESSVVCKKFIIQ